MFLSHTAAVILLDIEGTTTPVSYVFDVLFPFARDRAKAFLAAAENDAGVQADLALLRQEYLQESAAAPPWASDWPVAAVPYIHYLIERDHKSTGLKSLQGKIWDAGYQSGQLRSQLFTDVLPALKRWQKAGKAIYIFSSGSVQAQKLIFQYSESGDLTGYISGYFDTNTGPKREVESYQKIAEKVSCAPDKILFISDVAAELRAAKAAGLQTLFSSRPGNHTNDAEEFHKVEDFTSV